jgi:hypothetical protein
MSVKTAGVGHFQIPTAPAAGTSVTSGAANTYTTTPVQLIASTAAALYITGIHVEAAAASAATYKSTQLMIGAGGSETILGQYLVPLSTGSTSALGFRPIFPPIPVAASQRISVKTADSVGSQATLITLECIAQTNVVDDGVAQSANVIQWSSGAVPAPNVTGVPIVDEKYLLGTVIPAPATAGIRDVNVKNINNVATTSVTTINANQGTTQPVNFTGTGASALAKTDTIDWNSTAVATPATAGIPEVNVKNINNVSASAVTTVKAVQGLTTADTITTTTNLTNLPSIPANWLTAAGIAASALNGKGDWNIGKTGYALSAAGVQAIWDALTSALTTVGSIGKLLVTNIDAAISSRSTYAGGDTSGTTTLLSRLTGTRATNLDNLDATVSSRSTYAGTDTSGTTTLLGRLTAGRATNLDNLDKAVSTVPASVWDELPANHPDSPTMASVLIATTNLPTATQNADALLTRDWTAVASPASRSVMNALRFIRNKFSLTATPGSVTVYAEDDTTVAFTKTVTTDDTAKPIVEG